MGDELLGGGDQHPAAADFQLEERIGFAVIIVRDSACELSGRGHAVAGVAAVVVGVGIIVAAASAAVVVAGVVVCVVAIVISAVSAVFRAAVPHLEARNGESDQVLHVEFVVILLVEPDAEFEAEQLLRPAFGVEVGECGDGA